jgi:hypothetical protein
VKAYIGGGDPIAHGAPDRVDALEVQALLRKLAQCNRKYPMAVRALLS